MPETLTRQGKVPICALAACEGLVEKGLLEGGRWQLSDQGRETYARLKAEGFEATPDELREAMATLQAEVNLDA
jgi:hypothetical protein